MNLKKLLFFLCFFVAHTTMYAQYSSENSFMRKALVLYQKNSEGLYDCKKNVMVDNVRDVVSAYAFDKKSNNLYVRTSNGNYVVTLNKDYAKLVKNNKQIPKHTEQEIESLISSINTDLDNSFREKNDSIKLIRQRKREKEIADSIEFARQQEKKEEDEKQAFEKYRKESIANFIPINGMQLKCSICDKVYANTYVKCLSIKNDSIYFWTRKTEELEDEYNEMHIAPISKELKTNPNFIYHIQAFKDTLCKKDNVDLSLIEYVNKNEVYEHLNRVAEMAPYGYIEDWGWNGDYFVSFHFNYFNINSKTIKYIDVYWKITNDVNDLRKTGHFKGTGPLAQYESAKWDWDTSLYSISGDATNMQLTKVVLTYMDGSQKILNKGQFYTNNTSDYTDEMEPSYKYSTEFVSSYKTNNNKDVEIPATYSKGAVELYNDIQLNLVYDKNIGEKSIKYSMLKLEINKDGTVGEIKVEESIGKDYDNAAINAAKKLSKFIPAKNGGENYKVWFKLPVAFYFE